MDFDQLCVFVIYEDRNKVEVPSGLPKSSKAEIARSIASVQEALFVQNELAKLGIKSQAIETAELRSQLWLEKIKAARNPKIIWNVTDGDTPLKGGSVPALARLIGVPFLGSSSYVRAVCNAKHHWKALLKDRGVPVCPHTVVYNVADLEGLMKAPIQLPAFIKPSRFGNSAGMSLITPICTGVKEIVENTRALLENGLGPVLVEPFLSGTEFAVASIQMNQWVLSAYRKSYPEPYLSAEVKDGARKHLFSVTEIEDTRLEQIALEAISTLGIKDYVRFDFREDQKGQIYLIDINSGCFLLGNTMRNFVSRQGTSFGDGFRRLIEYSLKRQRAINPNSLH